MWIDTFFFALVLERCIHLDRVWIWFTQVNMTYCSFDPLLEPDPLFEPLDPTIVAFAIT